MKEKADKPKFFLFRVGMDSGEPIPIYSMIINKNNEFIWIPIQESRNRTRSIKRKKKKLILYDEALKTEELNKIRKKEKLYNWIIEQLSGKVAHWDPNFHDFTYCDYKYYNKITDKENGLKKGDFVLFYSTLVEIYKNKEFISDPRISLFTNAPKIIGLVGYYKLAADPLKLEAKVNSKKYDKRLYRSPHFLDNDKDGYYYLVGNKRESKRLNKVFILADRSDLDGTNYYMKNEINTKYFNFERTGLNRHYSFIESKNIRKLLEHLDKRN